jgi:pyruvate dehydrogenase E2 component (dihydrolipoamide acetyltransferase)
MAEVVNMIALSPTMEEGTLAEWRKQEGDTVEEGEVIADVETDKATMEMESWYDGTVLKILAEPDSSIAVGDPIAIVGEEGEDIDDLLADLEGGGGPAAEAEPEQTAAEAETEAAEAETPEPEAAPEAEEPAKAEPETAEAPAAEQEGRLRASPLARRIAADKGIDLARIEGSGPAGRIIKRDVEEAAERPEPAEPAAPTPQRPEPAAAETPAQPAEIAGEEVPLSQMRKTIAERLQSSWQSAPHFMLTVDIDMADAMARRKEINEALEGSERGGKISVNDFIVKACAEGLREYPKMNVAYQGDHVMQYDEVHIGVAVAVEDGLVTPTIRDADQKSLSAISRESRELAEKARNKNLEPGDYGGSTFSVSNLGMFGIDHFTAVLNPPEAGILACGAVKEVPVAEDGELTVGTRMKVTLSCDHRAVDGAMGAEFLDKVKNLLENPVLLTV